MGASERGMKDWLRFSSDWHFSQAAEFEYTEWVEEYKSLYRGYVLYAGCGLQECFGMEEAS